MYIHMSAWIAHVKEYCQKTNCKYRDALRDPKCKESYHKLTKGKGLRAVARKLHGRGIEGGGPVEAEAMDPRPRPVNAVMALTNQQNLLSAMVRNLSRLENANDDLEAVENELEQVGRVLHDIMTGVEPPRDRHGNAVTNVPAILRHASQLINQMRQRYGNGITTLVMGAEDMREEDVWDDIVGLGMKRNKKGSKEAMEWGQKMKRLRELKRQKTEK